MKGGEFLDRSYRRTLFKYTKKLLPLNHVVGVGYGKKVKKMRKTDQNSIVVMVDKKMPENSLNKKDLIPQKLEHIKTDVQEVGNLSLLKQPRSDRYRPAPAGVSIGHYKISAGTLGAVVKDNKTGEPLILSNNHVLANITNGRDGRAKIGDPILQPGSYDKGNNKDDIIGHLLRYIPLKEKTGIFGSSNIVDCALARPVNKEIVDTNILEIGQINEIREAEIDMKVIKSGRTTGLTEGRITAIDSTVTVNIDDDKQAIFTDQIVMSPISKGGDSGSLVLDKDRNVIGLLFAGSNKATVCNKISNVMKELNIDFFKPVKDEANVNEQYRNTPNFSLFLILILLIIGNRIIIK